MRVPAAASCAALALLAPAQPARAATWRTTLVVTTPRLNQVTEVAISGSGRLVVELGRTGAAGPVGQSPSPQIVAYDTTSRKSTLVSVGFDGKPANDYVAGLAVSADGRYVLFESLARNLVRDDTNGAMDVFLRDLARRRTTRVSLDHKGRQLPTGASQGALSRDGSTVAFNACGAVAATSKVSVSECGLYVRSLRTRKVVSASDDATGATQSGYRPSLSADGRYVCFVSPGFNKLTPDSPDTYHEQVYVYDVRRRTRVRVPEDGIAVQGQRTDESHGYARIDPTGHWVATTQSSYVGSAAPVPNGRVVLANLATGAVTVLGSQLPGICCGAPPAFSDDGRYVVYAVAEADPAGQQLDVVYRRTLKTGALERVSAPAAAPCASDLGCARPTSVAAAVDRDGDRVALVTDVRATADDPDGWGDGYLVSR